MKFLKNNGFGILLCIVVAAVATVLGGIQIGSVSLEVVGAPVFAILLGMIITLCVPMLADDARLKTGIKFTSK